MTNPDPARRMARIATGLILVMAVIYIAARSHEDAHPVLPYVRAFAEASMVGGLADWFAVTALFRHPLGIPIPHTAIIPNNKDRIAETLARFLRTNFLIPAVLTRRLDGWDIAGAAARRLTAPTGDGRLRAGLTTMARQLLGALDETPIAAAIAAAARKKLAALDLATLAAQIIEATIAGGRQGALIDQGLNWAARALADNEALVREQVRARAGWLIRAAKLDAEISDQIIGALTKTLEEMAADPDHPMRQKATASLASFAHDLRHDEGTRAKAEALKAELLAHPAVADALEGLGAGLKASLMRATERTDGLTAGPVGETLARLGATLEGDPALRERLNSYARRAIVGTVTTHGDALTRLVSDTVKGWEAEVITAKLAGVVGRDLQYIRINGTVIGGLAGLAIHSAGQFL